MNIKYIIALILLISGFTSHAVTWQGQWSSTFGKISFIEKDVNTHSATLVFANYGKTGNIVGVSIAGVLYGLFFDTKEQKGGSIQFSQNETRDSFSGEWKYANIDKLLIWNGTKINDDYPKDLIGVDRFRSMEGQWKSNFGVLDMTQDGVFVEAKYSDKGQIYAIYNSSNNLMYGIFTNNDKYGFLEFVLNSDKLSFNGRWSWQTKAWAEQKWHGTKVK